MNPWPFQRCVVVERPLKLVKISQGCEIISTGWVLRIPLWASQIAATQKSKEDAIYMSTQIKDEDEDDGDGRKNKKNARNWRELGREHEKLPTKGLYNIFFLVVHRVRYLAGGSG